MPGGSARLRDPAPQNVSSVSFAAYIDPSGSDFVTAIVPQIHEGRRQRREAERQGPVGHRPQEFKARIRADSSSPVPPSPNRWRSREPASGGRGCSASLGGRANDLLGHAGPPVEVQGGELLRRVLAGVLHVQVDDLRLRWQVDQDEPPPVGRVVDGERGRRRARRRRRRRAGRSSPGARRRRSCGASR